MAIPKKPLYIEINVKHVDGKRIDDFFTWDMNAADMVDLLAWAGCRMNPGTATGKALEFINRFRQLAERVIESEKGRISTEGNDYAN